MLPSRAKKRKKKKDRKRATDDDTRLKPPSFTRRTNTCRFSTTQHCLGQSAPEKQKRVDSCEGVGLISAANALGIYVQMETVGFSLPGPPLVAPASLIFVVHASLVLVRTPRSGRASCCRRLTTRKLEKIQTLVHFGTNRTLERVRNRHSYCCKCLSHRAAGGPVETPAKAGWTSGCCRCARGSSSSSLNRHQQQKAKD